MNQKKITKARSINEVQFRNNLELQQKEDDQLSQTVNYSIKKENIKVLSTDFINERYENTNPNNLNNVFDTITPKNEKDMVVNISSLDIDGEYTVDKNSNNISLQDNIDEKANQTKKEKVNLINQSNKKLIVSNYCNFKLIRCITVIIIIVLTIGGIAYLLF